MSRKTPKRHERIDLRASVPTDGGHLEVVARHIDGRWWVVARCRRWRGFGMAPELGSAVAAALEPYREGVSVTEAKPR